MLKFSKICKNKSLILLHYHRFLSLLEALNVTPTDIYMVDK